MSDSTDFDFFHGKWLLNQRKLRDVMDPRCTEWVEFTATAEVRPIFGGLGSIELSHNEYDPPFDGLTLRVFDPEAKLWRVWWISTRAPGYLGPADEGRFEDGRGVFLCEEELGGRAGLVRHQWIGTDNDSPRWEQAFSFDGGETWATNWVTTPTRVG